MWKIILQNGILKKKNSCYYRYEYDMMSFTQKRIWYDVGHFDWHNTKYKNMARGLILSSPTLTANSFLASFSKTPPKSFKLSLPFSHLLHHHHYHPQPCLLPFACCFCMSSSSSSPTTECPIDMSKYKEAFSKRMAMAGLKPHHKIGNLQKNWIFFFPSGKFLLFMQLGVCPFDIFVICW